MFPAPLDLPCSCSKHFTKFENWAKFGSRCSPRKKDMKTFGIKFNIQMAKKIKGG